MAKPKRVARLKSKRSARKPDNRRPAVRKKGQGPRRKTTVTAASRAGSRPTARAAAPRPKTAKRRPKSVKTPRIDRVRRRLADIDTVQTPPSSLNLDRHGYAARTGRAEIQARMRDHRGMSPSITGGDVDVDVENAYFTGDEAPGGDNPSPDQEVVDDIGKALGVQYEDNEELQGSDKIVKRDRHRWERDPASAEDYQKRR